MQICYRIIGERKNKWQSDTMERNIIITISIQELRDLIHEAVRSELKAHQTEIKSNTHKPEYLSRNQVAQMLGVCAPTLSAYIKRGLIPASRVSGKILLNRKEVEDALIKIRTIKHQRRLA